MKERGDLTARWTRERYDRLVKDVSPPSAWVKNCFAAFFFGGGICALGETLFTFFSLFGLEETTCRSAVSVVLIAAASLLTGMKVFDKIAKVAGAGTLVPITGFANAVVAPAMEFKSEGLVTGVGSKLFVIAGPVLVYGIAASVLYGLVYWFAGLFV